MSAARHFASEMWKIAFSLKAPPVLTSTLGKTTQGVVAKPQTLGFKPNVKTPLTKFPSAVRSSGKTFGTKVDPARANPPPPQVYGGTNVQ